MGRIWRNGGGEGGRESKEKVDVWDEMKERREWQRRREKNEGKNKEERKEI